MTLIQKRDKQGHQMTLIKKNVTDRGHQMNLIKKRDGQGAPNDLE